MDDIALQKGKLSSKEIKRFESGGSDSKFYRVKKGLTKKIKFNRGGRQKKDRRRKSWEEHITRRLWSTNMKTGLCACLNKFWVPSTFPRWPPQISLYTSDHSFIHYRLNDFYFCFHEKDENRHYNLSCTGDICMHFSQKATFGTIAINWICNAKIHFAILIHQKQQLFTVKSKTHGETCALNPP